MTITKSDKRIYWVFMTISIIIGVIFFGNLLFRSKNAGKSWIECEIHEKIINNYVYIGKNVFVQLDTFWFSVIYNPVFEDLKPIGCNFSKEKGKTYYKINCKDTLMNVWTGSGGFVTDKIWLRRIDMALKKKERQTNK